MSMADVNFRIVLTDGGEYRWSLVGADGQTIPLEPGSVPHLGGESGGAALRKAVQAGLKLLYDRQQAAGAVAR